MSPLYDRQVRVLVVEDDVIDRKVIQKQLAEAPIAIEAQNSAVSLTQTLETLAQGAFDVVLLDLNLPDSCGLETLVRVHARFSDLAIVVVTGEGGDDLGLEAVREGAQDYLVKGEYGVQALAKSLSFACERKRTVEAMLRAKESAEEANQGLAQANLRLEGMIAEANALAQEALAASKAKNLFLANMSHEVRTPMNAIMGFTELLAESELTASQRTYVGFIQTAGDGLLTLMNNVLDFSRMEAGEYALRRRSCNLCELVASVEGVLRPEAIGKGISLRTEVKADLPQRIVTDAAGLRQCLLNLIGNAIKFSVRGTVEVTVSAETHEQQPHLRVDIADTGVGIPEDKLRCIFEAFVQADGESTRRHEGVGLGLTLSQRVAHLLGGSITAESRPGKGSTFTLRVPLVHETPAGEGGLGLSEFPRGGESMIGKKGYLNPALKVDSPSRAGPAFDSDLLLGQRGVEKERGAEERRAASDRRNEARGRQLAGDPPVDGTSFAAGGHSDQTLLELGAVFLAETPSLWVCLRAAVERVDYGASTSWAQQLRGLARALSAHRLTQDLGHLVRGAQSEDLRVMTAGLKKAEKELNRVIELLSRADWIEVVRQVTTQTAAERTQCMKIELGEVS